MATRDYFKGKRIAIIGLGPHGEMVTDIKYLIKAGALVAVYDLRSEARLKSHLVFLRSIGLANYVCGSIPAEDLLDMDLIILSSEYPRESEFLRTIHAFNKTEGVKKIPIEYPETLFFRLAPPVTVVGVMGDCGKSTVMSMLTPLLEEACKNYESQGFFIIDPETAGGVLVHLKKIKNGDIVLVRIISAMMRELYALRISPHVAVFTTIPGALSYESLPFEILSYQTYNNFIVGSDEVVDAIHRLKVQPKAKMLRTKGSLVPPDWLLAGRGVHDRDNAALALQAARLFKIDDDRAREVIEAWKPLRNHLEPVKKVKNVEFFNDSASVSPYATHAAMQSLAHNRNAILIFGGADCGADYRSLYSCVQTYAHTMILIPGSGTMKQRAALGKLEGIAIHSAPSVEEAVRLSLEYAKKGDRVVFSPGFEAGGLDRSRKERGERFVKAVRAL